MRRYLKRRLLAQLQILNEAQQDAWDLLRSGNSAYAVWLECQNVAIETGTAIEESEGEGTKAVAYLEEYCELLYQMVSAEGNGQSVKNEKQLFRKIENKLKLAEQSLKKDIEERMEVVFLPYKASMWDSLESVWMAADADAACDAYVIPIPYYDKNTDGTFGCRHYEAHLYPSNVPVTSYEEYSLEKHHPDRIFIHNPYDQYNKLTSIDPAFYAKKLKQYTDELIYIPYFVSGDSVPESFCVLPGTMYADKVILENEQVKKIYVQEYEKMIGAGSARGKFLALGSPKYDRLAAMTKENIEIPQDWQDKINGKKVILYNITLSALGRPEKMLDKIENVLRVFKEQSEVVLLWRPHPLYHQSLCSLNPVFAERYLKIVETYKEENYGIFDDTTDLERAIVISDAYYGDGGSVPMLYKMTGKPMMYQNIDISYEGEG